MTDFLCDLLSNRFYFPPFGGIGTYYHEKLPYPSFLLPDQYRKYNRICAAPPVVKIGSRGEVEYSTKVFDAQLH